MKQHRSEPTMPSFLPPYQHRLHSSTLSNRPPLQPSLTAEDAKADTMPSSPQPSSPRAHDHRFYPTIPSKRVPLPSSIPPTHCPSPIPPSLPPLPSSLLRTPPVILRWSTLLACHHEERTRTFNPPSSVQHQFPPDGPSFDMVLNADAPHIRHDIPSRLSSHLVIPPLHKDFDTALRSKSPISAANYLRSCLETSQSAYHYKIVSKNLWYFTADAFFTEPVLEDIISGTFSSTPLSDKHYLGFSIISTLLLDPANPPGTSKKHPLLPPQGFQHYSDILKFVAGCKWFLHSILDIEFLNSCIIFQGIVYIEKSLQRHNLPERWSSYSTQATASYKILELVHNLFSLLGSLACNSSLNSIIPIVLWDGPISEGVSAHIISSSIRDKTLFLDLDSSLATWKNSCDDVFRELGGSLGSLNHLLISSQQASFGHFLFTKPHQKRPRFDSALITHEEHPQKQSRTSRSCST